MIIGITGSLGTGKTTVAKMFAAKGATVLDADRLSHMALRKGTPTYKQIISHFGRAVLGKDKSVNKRSLARIVFRNKRKLKRLTGIVHPFVIGKIKDSIKRKAPEEVIIIDAPLLIEADLTGIIDKLIVVKTGRTTQLLRCMKKKKLKREEAVSRIKNQMPLSKKIRMADYVINNGGTLQETRKQVDKIWRKIKWT